LKAVLTNSNSFLIRSLPDPGGQNIWQIKIEVLWKNNSKKYCCTYLIPDTKSIVVASGTAFGTGSGFARES
jgi:hypothetical protein